jgi:hypothetical protein
MNPGGAPPTVHHAPSFAGGRLGLLNRVMAARQQAAALGSTARLILDDKLMQARDLELAVQNAHGDVVVLPVPDHGKLGFGSAAALRAHLEDLLPPTGEQAEMLDFLLPEPGLTPLASAAALWSGLFPDLEVTTLGHGDPAPEELPPQPEVEVLWLSPRLHQTMKDLGLSPADLRLGENHCKTKLPRLPVGAMEEELASMEEELQARLATLKELAEQVDRSLTGAWVRMRRDLLAATTEFAASADRSGRNRSGTRGARLHALAQVARPHEQPQAEGLSLLSLACSHQWHPSRREPYATSLSHCEPGEGLLLTL